MSIFPQTATLLLKEHAHKAITGEVLLIGRQTVLLNEKEALALIRECGLDPRPNFLRETDSSTVGSDVGRYITDRSFFSMFSDVRVKALDVSTYEGAEIVHDLNLDLPLNLHGTADFIFNGSCLDNLFDPATAIKSLSKMLKPGGRIVHLEHGSPIQDAFLCYSPEWFFSFYAVNNYADCQTLICTFPDGMQHDWLVSRWQPYLDAKANGASLGIGDFLNIVIAEKGPNSTDIRPPIQSHYRTLQADSREDMYRRKALEFEARARPYTMAPRRLHGLPRPPRFRAIAGQVLNRLEAVWPSLANFIRRSGRVAFPWSPMGNT
jgi:SAM-dependent methyltransferase